MSDYIICLFFRDEEMFDLQNKWNEIKSIINMKNIVNNNSKLTLKSYSNNIDILLSHFNNEGINVYNEINDEHTSLEIKNKIELHSKWSIELIYTEYRLRSTKHRRINNNTGSLSDIINIPEKLTFCDNKIADAIKDFVFKIWHKIEAQSYMSFYYEENFIEVIFYNHLENADILIVIEY